MCHIAPHSNPEPVILFPKKRSIKGIILIYELLISKNLVFLRQIIIINNH